MSRSADPAPFSFSVTAPLLNGAHTSPALSRAVDRGEMLRLERGVYLPRAIWTEASRWQRYLIALAAHAHVRPEDIFAGDSAIAAHGLPQLRVPEKVCVLCTAQNKAGTRRSASLTGRAAPMLQGLRPAALKRVEPPLPAGISRPDHRAALRTGAEAPASERLRTPPKPWLPMPSGGLRSQPLAEALLSTVPQQDLAAGVVMLDAARRTGGLSGRALTEEVLEAHLDLLRSRRARHAFATAWDFSSPLSESPGESWSRVIFQEWGLAPPELQKQLRLPDGRSARVDFWWEGAGVVGEFDGMVKYRPDAGLGARPAEDTVIAEKQREDQLRSLGLRVVRWVWADLWDPARLAGMLRRAGVPAAG